MRLSLSLIRTDGGTQSRAGLNQETVESYAEAMREGAAFPPVIVFHDGSAHWLADGFHRRFAAQQAGLVEIEADVRPGTAQDALWYALGANKTNGLRPSRGDIKFAVELALRTWPDRTQREIAEQVGCAFQYVSRIKADVSTSGHVSLPETRTDTLGRNQPTRKARKAGAKETEQVDSEPTIPTPEPRPERDLPKARGVAYRYSTEAIAWLQKIPVRDPLRDDALDDVARWIAHNR